MLPRAVSRLPQGLPLKGPETWEGVCSGDGLGILCRSSSCVVPTALPRGRTLPSPKGAQKMSFKGIESASGNRAMIL